MRFYDIALYLFLFNLSLSFLNVMLEPYTDGSVSGLGAFGTSEDIIKAESELSSQVSDPSNQAFPELNFLVENVRLSIQGISTFLGFFANATIMFPFMWTQLLAGAGFSSPIIDLFILMISAPFYFIYLFAIIQWATGRSARDAQ